MSKSAIHYNAGKFRPVYGDVEAALPIGVMYFDDVSLDEYVEQAKRNEEKFDRLLAEMGVSVASGSNNPVPQSE
jgi:hypothetical protein